MLLVVTGSAAQILRNLYPSRGRGSLLPSLKGCVNATSTGLSKINGTKLKELRQIFLKRADWAVNWQVTLPGRTGGGNFKTGDISFTQPCNKNYRTFEIFKFDQ